MSDSTSVLDRVFAQQTTNLDGHAAADPGLVQSAPILYELMTAIPVVNGKARQTATLTIVAEDGVWKGGVRDRDHSLSLWVSAESLGGVVDALERALEATPVAWRRTTPYNSPHTRKST